MSASTSRKDVIFAFVLVNSMVFQTTLAACPPGWLAWQDACYVLLPDKMNWLEASTGCDRPGSSLIVPDSQEEHDFIWREMKVWMQKFGAVYKSDRELWIGCRDVDNLGRVNCSGVERGDYRYTNWDVGEPGSITELCVRMADKFGGQWGDALCSNKLYVACEMAACSRCDCRPNAHFNHVPQTCLFNHEIRSVHVQQSIACGLACHSFNLRQQAEDELVCQLNNATCLGTDSADFKYAENCAFYKL